MADVAIVVGHHPDAPGARMEVGTHAIHEYDFWRPFAVELALTMEEGHLTPHVVERPHEAPDQALAERVNQTGADAAIELHFNAAGDSSARGTEMLYYDGSADGKRLAEALQDCVIDTLGVPDRGLMPVKRYPFLQLTEMPAVICEPFFGSNRADVGRALTRLPRLQTAYRNALIGFCDEVV